MLKKIMKKNSFFSILKQPDYWAHLVGITRRAIRDPSQHLHNVLPHKQDPPQMYFHPPIYSVLFLRGFTVKWSTKFIFALNFSRFFYFRRNFRRA